MSDTTAREDGEGLESLGGLTDRLCDRAEAAWKARKPPRIEDFLGEIPDPGRAELFRSLLVMELAYRRRGGDQPTLKEYRTRFPEHAAVIDAVLGAARPSPPIDRPGAFADNNLLFGLLAFQNNFIGREKLLTALNVWLADKTKTLGRILLERGAVDEETHALLEAIARKHLQMHGGDLEESLAALSSLGSVREDLERVADPDLQASLSRIPSTEHRVDPDATGPRARAADATTVSGKQRFRVLRLHKEGGLGSVYVAHDEELHRDVALKEIKARHAHDRDCRSRFVQEAEITGRLEHPGIIPIYGLGTYDDGRPFYTMRFIKGDNLKDAIANFHKADVPGRDPGERTLALRELLRRFLDVCNAMGYAHSQGILHRDLKPNNVLLGPYGETLVVDWGLAKPVGRAKDGSPTVEQTLRPDSADAVDPTRQGQTSGTPAYMSPEQAAGDLDLLGLRSDVYSLGATLYCLLTGKPPFDGPDIAILEKVQRSEFPPPRNVKQGIAPALEAVCLKAMALRPEDRYATPGALAEDLERWLADEPVSAYPETRSRRLSRWMNRHRYAVRATLVTLLLITSGAITSTIMVDQARRKERKALIGEQRALASTRKALATEALASAEARRQRNLAEENTRLARESVDVLETLVNNPTPGRDDPAMRLERIKQELARSKAQRSSSITYLDLGFESLDPSAWKTTSQPKGWVVGSDGFEVEVDPASVRSGRKSLRIKSSPKSFQRTGFASREIAATGARGKRFGVSGYIRTEGVTTGYAGLWCRVDETDGTIALDTMGSRYEHVDPRTGRPSWDVKAGGRGVRGTTAWTRVDIELPVAPDATRIAFGGMLAGDGTAWFDGLAVEVDGKPIAEVQAALAKDGRPRDFNLDFEEDEPGLVTPAAWNWNGVDGRLGGGQVGYALEVDAKTVKLGKQSLRMISTGEAQKGHFGVTIRSITASPALGRRVRISGDIKTEGITKGYAGLWCRIDGRDGKIMGFDNMAARNGSDRVTVEDDRGVRGTTPWSRYQVEVEVDPDAVDIAFGCLLTGDGTAWFDGITIEIDGRPMAEALATKLTREQAAFGLGKGYLPLTYSMKVPPDWKIVAPSDVPLLVPSLRRAWRTGHGNLVVVTLSNAGGDIGPRKLLDIHKPSTGGGVRGTITAADVRPVAGMRAAWLISTFGGHGKFLNLEPAALLTEHLVGIPRGNDILVFALEARPEQFQADSAEFEEMLKTLEVDGKQTKEQAESK